MTATHKPSIAERLQALRADITGLAQRAGRPADDIRLIAVSKRKPVTDIVAAVAAGQRAFGENQVQESRDKIPQLRQSEIEWHYIGRLQKNKAKYIPGLFQWLHSLDNMALAEKLNKECTGRNGRLNVLLQVNASRDPNKQGIEPKRLFAFIDELLAEKFDFLTPRGLMTIGILTDDDNITAQNFAELRALLEQCQQRFALADFDQLSMGMSTDYAIAIREGATMIRIGSAIFGPR